MLGLGALRRIVLCCITLCGVALCGFASCHGALCYASLCGVALRRVVLLGSCCGGTMVTRTFVLSPSVSTLPLFRTELHVLGDMYNVREHACRSDGLLRRV